jgi:hypothetical protein
MLLLLKLLLCGSGNYIWGRDTEYHKLIGAYLIGIGVWIGMGVVWALPVCIGLAWFWRVWTAAPWLEMASGSGNWATAAQRSAAVLPLAIFSVYMGALPLLSISATVGIILFVPHIYKYFGNNGKTDGTAKAEFVSGLLLGAL